MGLLYQNKLYNTNISKAMTLSNPDKQTERRVKYRLANPLPPKRPKDDLGYDYVDDQERRYILPTVSDERAHDLANQTGGIFLNCVIPRSALSKGVEQPNATIRERILLYRAYTKDDYRPVGYFVVIETGFKRINSATGYVIVRKDDGGYSSQPPTAGEAF